LFARSPIIHAPVVKNVRLKPKIVSVVPKTVSRVPKIISRFPILTGGFQNQKITGLIAKILSLAMGLHFV
jgi:hypothetical protein